MSYLKKIIWYGWVLSCWLSTMMGMEEKIREQWRDNVSLAIGLMERSDRINKIVNYCDEVGGTTTIFDASDKTVKTIFQDESECSMRYLRFLFLVEENEIGYLKNGIVYDSQGNFVKDFSIDAMHEKKKFHKVRNVLGKIKNVVYSS